MGHFLSAQSQPFPLQIIPDQACGGSLQLGLIPHQESGFLIVD